jgi:hypothetical protein
VKTRFASSSIALAIAFVLGGSATFLAADDGNTDRNNQFDFALVGDVPYAPTGFVGSKKVQIYPAPDYDAMIADINAHKKVLFTVHMGDIKAGDTWCQSDGTLSKDIPKDALGVPVATNIYTKNVSYFNAYQNASVYLLGDNEWTDCHRTNNGAYSPTERLAYIRNGAGFFNSNLSLGQRPITLTRQSSDAGYELYKENVMWRTGNIIFVGLNQPGSNNNHDRNIGASNPAPTDNSEAEYTARRDANIAWITKAFAAANADPNTKAVVIMQQANVFERFLETGQGYTRSGYEDFVRVLRNQTIAFGKPVVLVGGDTHTVRIDKPLMAVKDATGAFLNVAGNTFGYPSHTLATGTGATTPTSLFNNVTGAFCPVAAPGCVLASRVQNFTRVEVFGSPEVAWIRAVVDPFDPNVFSFATQTIAGTGHGRDGREDDDDLQ